MSQDTMKTSPRHVNCSGETHDDHGDQLRNAMARHETLELFRTYFTIEKPLVRKRISEMLKFIATKLSDE